MGFGTRRAADNAATRVTVPLLQPLAGFMRRDLFIVGTLMCLCLSTVLGQGQVATIRVQVRTAEHPVPGAEVVVAGATHQTDSTGNVTVSVMPGMVALTVVKAGYVATTALVQVAAGAQQDIVVDLQ